MAYISLMAMMCFSYVYEGASCGIWTDSDSRMLKLGFWLFLEAMLFVSTIFTFIMFLAIRSVSGLRMSLPFKKLIKDENKVKDLVN